MNPKNQINRREFLGGVTGLAAIAFASAYFGGLFKSLADTQNSGNITKPLKLIHVTDTHLDPAHPKTVKWIEMLVNKINADFSDVDFVLYGGDNFNNNVPGYDDALRFKKIADGLKCPWYSVRGNKESTPVPKGDPLTQSDYAKMFFPSDLKVSGRDWKLEKDRYTILGLDTTIEQKNNGVYTADTIAFVEKELKANPERYFILLNHQTYGNFWGSTDKKDIHNYVLNNVDEVKKRLFGYQNLILTLSGHKHLDHVGQTKSVTEIATPGFVVPQNPHNENDHRFRYLEISNALVSQKLVSIA